MRLTKNEPLKRLKGIAFGELEGQGEWTFNEQNGIIQIQYNWDVYTKKNWMNYLTFVLNLHLSITIIGDALGCYWVGKKASCKFAEG